MQGNVAQALALVVAGNALLSGREIGSFWPDNSVFEFTKRCQFLSPPITGKFPLSSEYVAATPSDWFNKEGPDCLGFRLRRTVRANPTDIAAMDSNRMSVGFVGGGPRWLVEVVRPTSSELWEGRDEVLDRSAVDRKIWATSYLRILDHWSPAGPISRDALTISSELSDVLPQLESLAAEIEMGQFIESFKSAASALTADPPTGSGYYSDIASLFPFDRQHLRLLAATESAWVFGLMGSWNDIGSLPGPLQLRYDKLSDHLFSLLCEAIVSIANSTFVASHA